MTDSPPRRGDVWLAELDKVRPVVVLAPDPMARLLNAVLAAPASSTVRGVSTEVAVGPADGVRLASVANLDNLPTRRARRLRATGEGALVRRESLRARSPPPNPGGATAPPQTRPTDRELAHRLPGIPRTGKATRVWSSAAVAAGPSLRGAEADTRGAAGPPGSPASATRRGHDPYDRRLSTSSSSARATSAGRPSPRPCSTPGSGTPGSTPTSTRPGSSPTDGRPATSASP